METKHEDTHINESILSEEILEDQKKNRIDHMTYLPGMEDIGSEILDQVVTAMEAYDYNTYTAEDVKRALAHAERTPEDLHPDRRNFQRYPPVHQQHCHFWRK